MAEIVDWQHTASMVIVGIVTFVGDCSRGILFPALWPLCQRLGGNKLLLGLLVSTFSVGRLIITTRMGIIADSSGHRQALLLSGAILIFGALLWANAPFLGGLGALFAAQFFLGLGTGSLGVTRSFVVEQTEPKKRTYILARLTSLQYAGFAATPMFGSAFVLAGSTMSPYWQYAFPAYLLFFIAIGTWVCVYYPFKDYEAIDFTNPNNAAKPTPSANSKNNDKKGSTFSLPVYLSPLTTNNFSFLGNQKKSRKEETGEYELIAELDDTSVSSKEELLGDEFATVKDSEDLSIGVLNPVVEESEGDIKRARFASDIESSAPASDEEEEAKALLVSDSASLSSPAPIDSLMKERVYNLMMFLNFSTRGVIAIMETQASQILLSQYNVSELRLGVYVSIAGSIGTVNLLCFKQFWCKHFTDYELMVGGMVVLGLAQTLAMTWGSVGSNKPMWRFLAAMFIVYSLAYPVANSAVLGIFSSLEQSGKQAKAQGRMAFMGSAARILFPIFSGLLEQYVEDGAAFGMALMVIAVSTIAVMLVEPEKVIASIAPEQFEGRLLIRPEVKSALLISSLFAVIAVVGTMSDWGVSKW